MYYTVILQVNSFYPGKIIIPEFPITMAYEHIAMLNYDSLALHFQCVKDSNVVDMERCNKIVQITGKEIK